MICKVENFRGGAWEILPSAGPSFALSPVMVVIFLKLCLTNCCCIQRTVISFNYVYLSFANSFCSPGKSSEESKQWTMFSAERRPDFDGLQCCRTPPALDFHLTFQSSRRVTFDTFYLPPLSQTWHKGATSILIKWNFTEAVKLGAHTEWIFKGGTR